MDLEISLNLTFKFNQIDDARMTYLIAILNENLARNKEMIQLKELFTETKNSLQNNNISNQKTLKTPDYNSEFSIDANVKLHSLISQVKDIFPDLGDGFIQKCLNEYGSVQDVIMKLLENNLSESLLLSDQQNTTVIPIVHSEKIIYDKVNLEIESIKASSSSQSNILSSRKNVFDGDKFDIFNRKDVDKNQVIFGKQVLKAPEIDSEFIQSQKPRILEYQFDDYDDEYDDTYDSTDVKMNETYDLDALQEPTETTLQVTEPKVIQTAKDPIKPYESLLASHYLKDPMFFASSRRKTAERAKIREFTQLSHQQIEGWAKMLERDPRKDSVLRKYEWKGNHPTDNPIEVALEVKPSETTNSSNKPKSSNKKPRGANHNRKSGHDRKLNKGMGGGQF